MELYVKRMADMTPEELYELIKARIDVFVVEQNCPYSELDGSDCDAWHLWLKEGDELLGYLRVLPADEHYSEVAIGRVLSLRRRQGVATALLKAGIETARERMGAKRLMTEAQVYARGLYEKVGFRQTSAEFLEDGIPHIRMEMEL